MPVPRFEDGALIPAVSNWENLVLDPNAGLVSAMEYECFIEIKSVLSVSLSLTLQQGVYTTKIGPDKRKSC